MLDLDIHPREELLYLPPDDVDVVENVELHHLRQPVKGEIGIDKPDQDASHSRDETPCFIAKLKILYVLVIKLIYLHIA